MRAILSRRLRGLEKQHPSPPGPQPNGGYETHFMASKPESPSAVEGRMLYPCEEHGASCRVDIIAIPGLRIRRILLIDDEPYGWG